MVNVAVPDFKLHKQKFNSILASDQIDHFSLIKMVKAAKSDEKIFQNLAEPLLDSHIELDSNWPDVNGYLGLISIILGGISFIGFIYMCLQFRSLQTLLMVLQQVHNVYSKPTLPSFIFEASTTTTDSSIFDSELLKEFTWVHKIFNSRSFNFYIFNWCSCVSYKT
jgi:hypothetical protein